MVNGPDVRTGLIFGPAGAARQTLARRTAESRRRLFRGGGRRGSVVFRGTTRAEFDRQRSVERARQLIKKSKQGLAALSSAEKVELQSIIKKVQTTRIAPSVARLSGLSRVQQLSELERSKIETEARQRETEKLALDLRRESLESRQRVLERLSGRGTLLPGVATKFNNEIKKLNTDVKSFNTKVTATQAKISRFGRKAGRITGAGITTTPTAAQQIPTLLEFRERVRKKETIEPLGFSMERVRATRKAGAEFGAAIVPAGLSIFGARGGAAVGSTLGLIEEGARFTVDVPLVGIERFIGKPIKIPIKERPPEITRVKRAIERFRGRRPTFFDLSLAERFRAQAKIPFAGQLLGFEQAITPEGRVVLTRAALRNFATSFALFFGPQAIAKTARVTTKARVPIQSFLAKRLKAPGLRPTLRFQVPALETRIPTPSELKIAEITRRRFKSIRQIRESFAGVQKKATQAEITRLLGKAPPGVITRPSKAGIRFGDIKIPKIKFEPPRPLVEATVRKVRPKKIVVLGPAKPKQVKVVFLDEKGGIGFGRPIQVPRPFPPIRIRVGRQIPRRVRVVRFQDLLKQFDIRTVKPRTGTRLRLTALGTALTQKQLQESIQFPLQALRDITGFKELQRSRDAQLGAQATRSISTQISRDITLQRSKQAQKLKQFQRQVQRTIKVPRLRLLERLPTRPRIPRRPRPLLFPLPGPIEVEEELRFFGRRKEGFNVFGRRRGKPTRINKVALTRQSALGLGFLLTDDSTLRSFFIKRAKGKAQRVGSLDIASGLLRSKFRRPKGKTKLARNSFVELSRFAIDSPGERAGITLKGRIASERNRAIRKVLKLPKKRKRKRKSKR